MKAKTALFVLGSVIGGALVVRGVSGMSYQSAVDVQFGLNQTLSIALSSNDLRIEDLTPGIVGESDPIQITVNTNNASGYKLTATVGTENNLTNNLVNPVGGVFTSINGTVGSFTDGGTWGVSTNNGDNFFGLPVYGAAGGLLNSSNGPVSGDVINFSIGAKGGAGQVMGEYSNTIQFAIVANPILTYMQGLPLSQCTDVAQLVYDSRDGEGYYVQRLADGNCWMLDNLRLDLLNPNILSNLSPSNTNADEASLTSLRSGNSNAGAQYATSGITTWSGSNADKSIPSINVAYDDDIVTNYGHGSGRVGIFYNYCAATAGSNCYSGDPSVYTVDYSVCPAGWSMPSGGANGDYNNLYNQYTGTTTEKNDNFKQETSVSLSGQVSWNSTTISDSDTQARLWTSTLYGDYGARAVVPYTMLYYQSGDNLVLTSGGLQRFNGLPVRCVLK